MAFEQLGKASETFSKAKFENSENFTLYWSATTLAASKG